MTTLAPSPTKTSPMMAQWNTCKQLAGEAILLFRMGDFYEAFYEDANILAKELELTLTKRQGIPMSGVPQHTCQTYVDKLVAKGFRVALAEQTEDPKKTKGLVKREVTRIVTPGTLVNSALLPEKGNNFFACIEQVGKSYGLAFIDISTSTFKTLEVYEEKDLVNELHRLSPKELLSSEKFFNNHPRLCQHLKESLNLPFHKTDNWRFDTQESYHTLTGHFNVISLDGFGLKEQTSSIHAAGALLSYLKDELLIDITPLTQLNTYSTKEYMSLDFTTLRNLELTESIREKNKKNTLLEVLDHTLTAMGGRLLTEWVCHPLLDIQKIKARQEGIGNFNEHYINTEKIRDVFGNIRDLERLNMKVASGYASPKDLASLRDSLQLLPEIKSKLLVYTASIIQANQTNLVDVSDLQNILESSLSESPPLKVSDGNIFKEGYHAELDEWRSISQNSKAWIKNYQENLKERLNIKSLKVGYSRAFGYYIEVSKGQAQLMPESFQRRQTLVNNERFISPELKEYENKVLSADEEMLALETKLFQELREKVMSYNKELHSIAKAIATLDVLLSLAHVARSMNYTCPKVDESDALYIQSGRHPVIESVCLSEAFVANDTELDGQDQRLMLITGPNMAGKSTYIRQVALIVIMAQIGSYVPAKSAHIGLVDKVFTRVGASDDLSRGQSTFMVEMSETANILNHVSDKSLVILDEIGRGTSTYDGIAIAWSVAEYLLTTPGKQAKTLFATHYWELTKMENQIKGAKNYTVAVQETDESIVFLRKILAGDTDKSYGVHVARLAGLPTAAIDRAKEILVHLEQNANQKNVFENQEESFVPAMKVKQSDSEIQFLLFEPNKQNNKKNSTLIESLKKLPINELTPVQALAELARLQEEASTL
jgi:DNA mismatch repair protein MutS